MSSNDIVNSAIEGYFRMWKERNRNADHACRHSGFTLAELLIVVAIIAVLVSVSIPIFTTQKEKAEISTCAANRRSLLSAFRAEEMSSTETATYTTVYQWLQTAVEQCGGNKDDVKQIGTGSTYTYTVTGFCSKKDGTYTVTFNAQEDTVSIVCSIEKHQEDSATTAETFAGKLNASILGSNIGSITRTLAKGDSQSLDTYLSDSGKTVDSEAPATNGSGDNSFTKVITDKLDSGSLDLSWMLTKDQTSKNYEVYVTSDGKLTASNNNNYVNVTRYVYDASGKEVSVTSGRMKVGSNKTTITYYRLSPGTFKTN